MNTNQKKELMIAIVSPNPSETTKEFLEGYGYTVIEVNAHNQERLKNGEEIKVAIIERVSPLAIPANPEDAKPLEACENFSANVVLLNPEDILENPTDYVKEKLREGLTEEGFSRLYPEDEPINVTKVTEQTLEGVKRTEATIKMDKPSAFAIITGLDKLPERETACICYNLPPGEHSVCCPLVGTDKEG